MYNSNGSSLPLRKSSRGMTGAPHANSPVPLPASNPGTPYGMGGPQFPHTPVPQQTPNPGNPYGVEGGPLKSSEEWQDKGAAVGVRQDMDVNGRPVFKHVKKGVKDFQFGRTLGEGSYSTVIAATDRQSGKEYAIKVLDKRHIIKEKKVKYVNIEKDTLNRLTDHPGVVRLYYTFQDEQSLYFVLDLASSGELLGVLKQTTTFDEECTRFYGAEILDTIDYMHARGVIHRDLKPENVLLDDQMHVKITDFGTAKILEVPQKPPLQNGDTGQGTGSPLDGADVNKANSFVGTAEYVSPELLTDKQACKASDLWAFGCIIYQLLAGRPPFKAGNEYLTFQKIVALEYQFPKGFPEVAKDLVQRLLVLDPAMRLSIEHIKNHQFFDGIVWGRGLWRQKAPKLKSYVPSEVKRFNGPPNGNGNSFPPDITPSHSTSTKRFEGPGSSVPRPSPRIITELPPPSQLDIEWSPVLTRNNERILKLGNLIVNSAPAPHSPNGRNGTQSDADTPKKFSRFFGSNTPKKRQRLVMVTSSARIIIVAAGGEEKKSKIEIPLFISGCVWRKLQDPKGLTYWCVDTVSNSGSTSIILFMADFEFSKINISPLKTPKLRLPMDQRHLHQRKSGSTLSRLLERSLYRKACQTLTPARTISKISSQGYRHPRVVSISIPLGPLKTVRLATLSRRIIPAMTHSWVGNASARDSRRADLLPCFKFNDNYAILSFSSIQNLRLQSNLVCLILSLRLANHISVSFL